MIEPRQIKEHIAGHAMWKVRLREALQGDASHLDAADIRPDDRCEFGKWIRGMDPTEQRSEHWKGVHELHRLFHESAADVVVALQQGNREDAERSLNLRGDLSRATSKLTRAMVAWQEASAS